MVWFVNELTSEERRIWRELAEKNPLLGDAYCQTLANRLTATRIIAKSRGEVLRVERQINRTRSLRGVDTSSLLDELHSDRERVDGVRQEATRRLAEAKAQLQSIEASANRKLSQVETDSMLRRLAASQALPPLALEMDQLEREALRELDHYEQKPGDQTNMQLARGPVQSSSKRLAPSWSQSLRQRVPSFQVLPQDLEFPSPSPVRRAGSSRRLSR